MNINVKRNSSGRAVSIDLTEVPERPNLTEAREALTAIGDALNLDGLTVTKVAGFWLLGDVSGEERRAIYGGRPAERTRSFDKLISEGLLITVVRLVPVR